MKKILGSPIGLGEINLTVDESVRRNLKEYFGNGDDNSFETTITPVAFTDDSSKVSKKQKIVVTADETHLDKVFILKINDVTIYFKPITKVGNKLEAEPYKIRDWDKIKDIAKSTLMYAKLPTTVNEKEAATVWEEDKLGTQDATDDAEVGATSKTKENEAVSALEENDCEYEASICCNEDEWKEKIKKEYEKSIEGGKIAIVMCVLLILWCTNIHISWVYYYIRIAFLPQKDNVLNDEQKDIKKDFEEKQKKTTTCRVCFWYWRLFLAFVILPLLIVVFLGKIKEIKKTIKELDSKKLKDISKDDKEDYLKECLMTKEEQAEETRKIEECESNVTQKWKNSTKQCVDKCTGGSICKDDKCETCGCGSEDEKYRKYSKHKCGPKCKISEQYCKSKNVCILKAYDCKHA